jgi:DNA-binding response OmpR family regulator
MAPARKILICDPDLDAARSLGRALRQRGYQVHVAPDGSKALEVCVLRHPDLVLFDDAARLIDARTFVQILRTNPRTSDIPVVLTTAALDSEKVRFFRDGFLRKPFNLDEVLARIDHLLRRSDAARQLRGEAREIEGSLTQLPLADLLQILAMNKRTGRLQLERQGERGEIHLDGGRPVNAKVGRVVFEGEKALFRLLTWVDGTFAFTPGPAPARPRINRAMDDALLEGMRQADEVARQWLALPPPNAHVVLSPEADLAEDQHPVTAQVVELLHQPRTVTELLDVSPATDLDTLVVLSTLLQRGVARSAEGAEQEQEPLLGPAEIHALRARLFRARPTGRTAVAKVFLLAAEPIEARRLLRELPGVAPVSAEPTALRSGFGTLGRFELGEALKIDLCLLPTSEGARPLWRPFSTGAVGALLLDGSEEAVRLARFLGFELRLPLVMLDGEIPPALQGAPAGVLAPVGHPLEAMRALLIQALNPPPPLDA